MRTVANILHNILCVYSHRSIFPTLNVQRHLCSMILNLLTNVSYTKMYTMAHNCVIASNDRNAKVRYFRSLNGANNEELWKANICLNERPTLTPDLICMMGMMHLLLWRKVALSTFSLLILISLFHHWPVRDYLRKTCSELSRWVTLYWGGRDTYVV